MDEITAEVESRQGNAAVNTVADDASLSGWTQVTDGDDENETPAAPADVPPEGAEEEEEEDELEVEEEEDDSEYDEDEEEFDEDEEQDETGNAIESNGRPNLLLYPYLKYTSSLNCGSLSFRLEVDQGCVDRCGIVREGLPWYGRYDRSSHGRETSRSAYGRVDQ